MPSSHNVDALSSAPRANLRLTNDADMSEETAVSRLVLVPDDTTATSAQAAKRRLELECSPDSEVRQTPKRVAVSGPSQRVLDDLRQHEEMTRQRALQHAIRVQNQRQEIRHLQDQLNNSAYETAVEGELESQMIDQIIHFEKQIHTLTSQNTDLTNVLQDGGRQLQELQRRNDEMQRKLDNLTVEHAREKERQQQEALALRQRLQAAENARSSQNTIATPPRIIRSAFTRGTPTRVAIVPLRPVNPMPTPSTPAAPSRAQSQDPEMIDLDTPSGVANITTIVKEVLSQLHITGSVVSETNPRTPRRQSARTRNQHAKSLQRQTLSKSDNLAWMDTVRNFWKTSFDITSITDFSQYEPAPANRVYAFETRGQNGPDSSNVLDFQKGYDRSRWNKTILTRLLTQLLEERAAEGNWGLPDVSEEYLMSLLHNQLKRSREAWSMVQARPNLEQNRMETEDDIIQRVSSYTSARLDAVGSRSRRERKYQRRLKATEKVILLKSESSAPDLNTWTYFRELLTKLSIDGMSSEEEGITKIGHVNVPVFRVKLCVWRHTAIRDYLKYIDSESQNPAIRPSRGSKLHPRIMTDEPGKTQPPPKLPETLFDPEWLKSEKELKGQRWIEDELQVSQDIFELLQFVAP